MSPKMEVLSYTARERGYLFDIQFNKAPGCRVREELYAMGFHYKQGVWTGSIRRKDEAIDMCERAVAQSQRHQEAHYRETLCWQCVHSCKGNLAPCSWVSEFVPVDGWNAAETRLKAHYRDKNGTGKTVPKIVTSYRVLSCPLYEKG